MMRSLFSGVSGLMVHQTRMDVIGNNLANVNTVGFKASRMTFKDAISQRLAGATSDNPELGRAGRNPFQVGLGVHIGAIDNLMFQGAAQRTDRPLDLTIQGEGFFVVSDHRGDFFTRAGNIDWNGYLFSIGGMQLMGWPADGANGLVPLTTPEETRFMNPSPTTLLDVTGNLNINDLVDGSIVREIRFYDTVGTRFTADVRFTWHPPGAEDLIPPSTNAMSYWSFDFLPLDEDGEPSNQVMIFPEGRRDRGIQAYLTISAPSGLVIGPTPEYQGVIGFDPRNGNIAEMWENAEFVLNLSVPATSPPGAPGADPEIDVPPTFNTGGIRFNVGAMRQQMGENTTLQIFYADGHVPGTLTDITIGSDGIITARYTNGEMRDLGTIPLATFLNPAGLERVGDNLWIPSANSGNVDFGYGDLIPGSLEMSNVEISSEFTEMITTQRGFQANSRIITTSDEMLQELVNLKR